MIIRSSKKPVTMVDFEKAGMGKGGMTLQNILSGDEQIGTAGRVFAHAVLEPGCGVKNHRHKGESETYYFLKGKGVFNDNGTEVTVVRGDVTHTVPGEEHALRCTGNEALEYIVLVLFQ